MRGHAAQGAPCHLVITPRAFSTRDLHPRSTPHLHPHLISIHTLSPSQVVINHGVELCDGAAKQIARAVELCARNFRKVRRGHAYSGWGGLTRSTARTRHMALPAMRGPLTSPPIRMIHAYRPVSKVPVLLIAASNEELTTLHKAVRARTPIPIELALTGLHP